MRQVDVDEQTYQVIRLAARIAGISEAEIVARAVRALPEGPPLAPVPAFDPWVEIPIYAVYQGERVDARFLPATRRVAVTSGPLAGRDFPTPSAAAGAIVAASNPGRRDTRTNGWRFWRVVETNGYLDSVKSPPPPATR